MHQKSARCSEVDRLGQHLDHNEILVLPEMPLLGSQNKIVEMLS